MHSKIQSYCLTIFFQSVIESDCTMQGNILEEATGVPLEEECRVFSQLYNGKFYMYEVIRTYPLPNNILLIFQNILQTRVSYEKSANPNLPTVFFVVRQYCLIFLSSIAILLPQFFQPHTFAVKMQPFFVAHFSLLHKRKERKKAKPLHLMQKHVQNVENSMYV